MWLEDKTLFDDLKMLDARDCRKESELVSIRNLFCGKLIIRKHNKEEKLASYSNSLLKLINNFKKQ